MLSSGLIARRMSCRHRSKFTSQPLDFASSVSILRCPRKFQRRYTTESSGRDLFGSDEARPHRFVLVERKLSRNECFFFRRRKIERRSVNISVFAKSKYCVNCYFEVWLQTDNGNWNVESTVRNIKNTVFTVNYVTGNWYHFYE